ncbi:Conserved hypothetical protein CHP02688 [Bacteroides coprosuis DSM 18011]|uniref:Uncharacterized protein n=1 Tax=Bacteroides coprosuis DSM 18011 TaxID=679937 RepID=F3ZRE9_9BACE|nr:BREX system Lon protease-like protein BrxL [Bacteroides coprosuis]EGJ71957.1 Conserved hypothetical protein CHP02688 [Bacteroides coprosuis DSM 18011]
MKELDQKINKVFGGKVVRKDLTSRIKGNAVVPTYVLEYLLGQYCATNDDKTIEEGIDLVKQIITQHFVHRDQAEVIKAIIREKGNHRIIDKVSVRLNDKFDLYEASFANISLRNIPINDVYVKKHPKLLSEGVWALINMGYLPMKDPKISPWIVESIKPIQISYVDIEEYKELRKEFTTEEWVDLLMQTIGLNPEEFSRRSKLIQLTRLIPFVENNYNLIELGPKGTGKSHIYSELSPHGILISGGEVTKAKLFVNNSTGDIGLVGYWDVVAYDEFAGKSKRVDQGLVDIMKNYMAQKSFSRGTHVYQAEASMVFVGNTDNSVNYMLKHSNLFEALPKDYYDPAFLDRIHAYIPGWEVQKLRSEMFTRDYGFIVDYLAEVLKHLRKEDYTKSYIDLFELSSTLTTRDKTGIEKTFSGLIKLLFPHGEYTEDEARSLFEFAIECRKRVKDQLEKMDETFNEDEVKFRYIDKSGESKDIETLELVQYRSKYQLETSKELGQTMPLASPEQTTKEKHFNELAPSHIEIRDNQMGISYESLFGPYLKSASVYKIEDPYIRRPYQIRNFMELIQLILQYKTPGEYIRIHLITNNEEEYLPQTLNNFKTIAYSLKEEDIDFTYEFKDVIHDRIIDMDNDWRIILGRGLDFWQRVDSEFDIAYYDQKSRKCKEFKVTILNHNNKSLLEDC